MYTSLGLESRRSTLDEIKKAYKKKSLNLHPDKLRQRGITITEVHQKEFLQVKEAYEILSDPKRRKIYDQIGLNGLKLLENPTEVDPMVFLKNFQKNRRDRYLMMLMILVIFAAIFFTPVLFAMKCDGDSSVANVPWVVVWIPVWVVDAALVLSAVLLFTMNTAGKKNGGAGNKGKSGETDASDGGKIRTATDEDEDKEEEDSDEEDQEVVISMAEKLTNLVCTVLFVLIQVFVLVKLDGGLGGNSKANWFEVLLPWFLYEGVSALTLCSAAFLQPVPPPDHSSIPEVGDEEDADAEAAMAHFMVETKHYEAVANQHADRKAVVVSLMRLWLGLFIAARLNQGVSGASNTWNWGAALVPLWVSIALELCVALYQRSEASSTLRGVDMESLFSKINMDYAVAAKVTHAQNVISSAGTTMIMQSVLLLMALLLVCRLEVSVYSTFVILFPVFIALGCCCLGVFCGFVTLANMDPDRMQEEFEANAGRGGHSSAGAQGEEQAAGEGLAASQSAAEEGYGSVGVTPTTSAPYAPPAVATPPVGNGTGSSNSIGSKAVNAADVSLDMLD